MVDTSKKSVKSCLRSTSGASLVVTLCVMLLLLAISVSVLSAAGNVASVNYSYKNLNILQAFNNSALETLSYNLQSSDDDDLGRRLMREIYEDYADDKNLDNFEIVLSGSDFPTPDGSTAKIKMEFTKHEISKTQGFPALYDYAVEPPARLRSYIPSKTSIKFELTATITSQLKNSNYKLTTRSTYEYTGGGVTFDLGPDGTVEDEAFAAPIYTYGNWRLISHERIQGK